MSKHFWLKNTKTGLRDYCLNSYGALNNLDDNRKNEFYANVWLTYEEIKEILKLKTKEERHNLCDKLFKEKYPQSKENQKELSKQEQSKLEKLFP